MSRTEADLKKLDILANYIESQYTVTATFRTGGAIAYIFAILGLYYQAWRDLPNRDIIYWGAIIVGGAFFSWQILSTNSKHHKRLAYVSGLIELIKNGGDLEALKDLLKELRMGKYPTNPPAQSPQ